MDNDLYLQGFVDAIELALFEVSRAKTKEEALKLLLAIKEDLELKKINKIREMLEESKLL